MPRLFVALDLPPAAVGRLVALQPPPASGVRVVAPDQMHLTLHFLGELDAGAVTRALAGVRERAFALRVTGVGSFPARGGAVMLWAGVERSPELLRLHAAVADALGDLGFRPEDREYAAHVTLARCEADAPPAVAAAFLAREVEPFDAPVAAFALYSSVFVDGVPVYTREGSFPLAGAR